MSTPTWSYSGDPSSSPRDEVRFLIGDTDIEYSYIQDKELDYILNHENGSVTATAISAVRRIIAQVAKQVNYKIGPEQVNAVERLNNFRKLLEELMSEFNSTGHIELSQPSTHEPIFDLGMDDYRGTRLHSPSVNGQWTR